ncbi:hypothetical protein D3C71_1522900 [compost metagenome]
MDRKPGWQQQEGHADHQRPQIEAPGAEGDHQAPGIRQCHGHLGASGRYPSECTPCLAIGFKRFHHAELPVAQQRCIGIGLVQQATIRTHIHDGAETGARVAIAEGRRQRATHHLQCVLLALRRVGQAFGGGNGYFVQRLVVEQLGQLTAFGNDEAKNRGPQQCHQQHLRQQQAAQQRGFEQTAHHPADPAHVLPASSLPGNSST